MSQTTIFLIEEDNDLRSSLREILKNYGYQLSLAIDEEDALERISNQRVKADLMLINLDGKLPEDILQIGRKISRSAKLEIPIIVIAANYDQALAGQDIQFGKNEYITYIEHPDQLFNLLSQLTALPDSK